MILAWGLFCIFVFFTISGLIGIFSNKYDTNYYTGVFFVSLLLALFAAQYIWG